MIREWTTASVTAFALLLATHAYGITVGSADPPSLVSPLPSVPDVAVPGLSVSGPGWIFPDFVDVALDPAAGRWQKDLLLPAGTPVPEGTSLTLVEILSVDGSLSWAGWHEEIITPGWAWTDGEFGVVAGGTISLAPGFILAGGPTSISFLFDPLPPGTDMVSVKAITFVGIDPGDTAESFTAGVVGVLQHPTGADAPIPEPLTGTTLVLACAMLGSYVRRRHRRS